MSLKKISKAVIPVAGLGTRMLPVTKVTSKELLPVYNKPIIQYIVEEAVSAGITEIIFITSSKKSRVLNYFKKNSDLEARLKNNNKKNILNIVNESKFNKIKFNQVIQKKPLGLGHAILKARDLIKEDAFAIFLPDELLITEKRKKSDFQRMMDNFYSNEKGQILVEEVQKNLISQYGVVKFSEKPIRNSESIDIFDIIEKPSSKKAPSNNRVVGRYILPKEIFDYLAKIRPGKDNEIQLTDALKDALFEKKMIIQAIKSKSKIYDCGSIKGLLGANIEFGMKDKETKQFLIKILNSPGGGIGRHKGLKIPR